MPAYNRIYSVAKKTAQLGAFIFKLANSNLGECKALSTIIFVSVDHDGCFFILVMTLLYN